MRERLAEIETIVSSGRSAQLAYCAQLSQRLSEREQEFVTEMDGLIASHEHRVRQLVQEIVDLRAELARKDKYVFGDNNTYSRSSPLRSSPSLKFDVPFALRGNMKGTFSLKNKNLFFHLNNKM